MDSCGQGVRQDDADPLLKAATSNPTPRAGFAGAPEWIRSRRPLGTPTPLLKAATFDPLGKARPRERAPRRFVVSARRR